MAPSPLSPRYQAAGVWTGSEMIVLGGLSHACAPGACGGGAMPDAFLTDVAAYNPTRDTWRMLAPVPFAPTRVSAVVNGHTLYVLNRRFIARASLWAYDLDKDAWRRLAPPPTGKRVGPLGLVAAGSKLYAAQERPQPDLLYDPATDTWSEVPTDPFAGRLYGDVVGLPDGRVVEIGLDFGDHTARGRRSYAAAVYDPQSHRWERMPRSPFVEGQDRGWLVAGERVVNLATERLPLTRGSKRLHPTGGQLDVRTKTWLPLPHRPPGDGYNRFTTSGGDVAVVDGWALDVAAGRWTKMPEIPGGPEGLTFTALAFTGEALLTWGGRIPDGGDYMHARSYSTIDQGWVWDRGAQPDAPADRGLPRADPPTSTRSGG